MAVEWIIKEEKKEKKEKEEEEEESSSSKKVGVIKKTTVTPAKEIKVADVIDEKKTAQGGKVDDDDDPHRGTSSSSLSLPTPDQLRRFREDVEASVKATPPTSVSATTIEGVEARLRLVGVVDPASISVCVKKALLEGFVTIEGPESLLQLVCYQRCPGRNCWKIIRVRLLEILLQDDVGVSDVRGRSSRRFAVTCDSPDCRLSLFVTNVCAGQPRLATKSDHHHCAQCPKGGRCLDDATLRHCTICGEHFYTYVVDDVIDPSRFPKMTCEGCQLKESDVCDFINRLRDLDAPLHPFELRLVGENQVNPCLLAAIQRKLVSFPRLPTEVAAKVRKRIERRNGIVILTKDMNVTDHMKMLSVTNQLLKCTLFSGSCFVCSAHLEITWGKFLYLDYDELRPNDDVVSLPVSCPNKNCRRKNFLIDVCRGTPRFGLVDFCQSHCTMCPGFGWCRSGSPSHCPRCGKHSPGVKGERLCDECGYEMTKKRKDVQLPEEERREIVKAAKLRNADPLFVEDNSIVEELEETCVIQ